MKVDTDLAFRHTNQQTSTVMQTSFDNVSVSARLLYAKTAKLFTILWPGIWRVNWAKKEEKETYKNGLYAKLGH